MPYGEMQLVAYGSQDLYLTGNPSITFFKAAYKRHTNFANEYIRQDFTKSPNFQTQSRTTAKCKIDRNADLINDVYLVYDLPNIFSGPKISYNDEGVPSVPIDGEYFRWVKNLGENIIHKTSIFIDGLLLDEQYGLWLNIWNELIIPKSKRRSYDMMIGNVAMLNNPSNYNGTYNGYYNDPNNGYYNDPKSESYNKPTINAYRLYIPLPFWFCSNPGLAIPLVSLQYNELFIHVEFNQLNDLFTIGKDPVSPSGLFDLDYINNFSSTNNKLANDLITGSPSYSENNLFWKFINNGLQNNSNWGEQTYLEVNYIFLDKDERRKFAQVSLEYLMTQVQMKYYILNNVNEGIKGSTNIINLNLNHPVKELIWVLRKNDVYKRNQWNNYTTSLYDYDYYENNNNFANKFASNKIVSTITGSDNLYTPNYYKKLYYDNYLINGPFNNYYDKNNYYNQNPNISFNQVNNIMYNAKLIFNGNDRFSVMDNNFFNYVQPYKYHTNTPSPGVNVYSFAIYPEDHQPSGTCNMSRISNVQMEIAVRQAMEKNSDTTVNTPTYEGYELYVFGVNYNILRIMGGMGGLVFSN